MNGNPLAPQPLAPTPAPPPMTGPSALTDREQYALELTVQLVHELAVIVGDPSHPDMHELVAHVHAIQHAVMANAAARAYPDLYRPLGGRPITTEAF